MTTPTDYEAETREISAQWLAAFHARDVPGMLRHYAPEVELFDLKPPLRLRGIEAVQQMWEECLPYMGGITGYEFHNVVVHASAEVALWHCTSHMTGTHNDGTPLEHWMRVTIGFRQQDGRWLVVHEHVSIPVRMEPPFAGAFNLAP